MFIISVNKSKCISTEVFFYFHTFVTSVPVGIFFCGSVDQIRDCFAKSIQLPLCCVNDTSPSHDPISLLPIRSPVAHIHGNIERLSLVSNVIL